MKPTSASELIDLQSAIDQRIPLLEGLSVLAAPLADLVEPLFPQEAALVAGSSAGRRREFSTGRVLARRAMMELGLPAQAIERGDNRAPLWPAGLVGSISHSSGWAVACVGLSSRFRSVGIDLECRQRVSERLHRKLFTDNERRLLAPFDTERAGLMFSAKEAGYKATNPLCGRYIGFQEAEVDLQPGEDRFRLRYVGAYEENRVMEQASGYSLKYGPYVLSLVIIPADTD
ncbi:MAG: 4'-phosphopantetheinyl transferase [Pseudomonadales bacterium]